MDVYKDWLGIPEGPRPPDYYTLLRCVRFEDNVDRIRAKYRKLNAHVRKYATGQYSVQSQDLLNELARAMLCLTDVESKRDYDQEQGRELPDEDAGARKTMGVVLVDAGKLTREQLREAEQFAEARGLSMRDAVVQMRLCDADTATQAWAQELGLAYVDLNDMLPDDKVLDKFPRNFVRRNGILPLFEEHGRLLVACAHEPTAALEDEVRLRSGLPMRAVIATPLAISQAHAKYYAPGMREQAGADGRAAGGDKGGAKSATSGGDTRRPRWSQLSSGEQKQRKQMGILFMCWATIGAVLVDQFVLRPLIFPKFAALILLTLIIPPIMIWWVLKVYWK